MSDFREHFRRDCRAHAVVSMMHRLDMSFERDGLALALPVIEGTLQAIGDWLQREAGPEAAYEHLQRFCDGIAQHVADDQRSQREDGI